MDQRIEMDVYKVDIELNVKKRDWRKDGKYISSVANMENEIKKTNTCNGRRPLSSKGRNKIKGK